MKEDTPYLKTTIRIRTLSCATKASDSWALVKSLDVFVFEDNGLRLLDQRQHLTKVSSSEVNVYSSEGDKSVVVIANLPAECSSGLEMIYDYEGLERVFSDYRYDSAQYPVMSGESVFSAGLSDCCEIVLRPVMAMVDISCVRCTGEARPLKNPTAYLLNLSCRCEVMRQNGFRPSEILCLDTMNEKDLRSMKEPSMAVRSLSFGDSDVEGVNWSGATLFCYPNDAVRESAGSPFTRLVIEGELDGVKRYYPLAVGRGMQQEGGILRDMRYSYKICLKSRGMDNPYDRPDPSDIVTGGSATIYPSPLIYASRGEKVHVWCETVPADAPVAVDMEALEDDAANGLHYYELDKDGRGVTLYLRERGTSIVYFEAGDPVFDAALAFVVVR